jgi:hypothetical protein
MAKKNRKARKTQPDFKKAAAHDVETPKTPAANASAVKKGAAYHVLAGRPSKPSVIATFGKAGYALSWVARAERMGMKPEDLCADFAADPKAVKVRWTALTEKK